MWGGGMRRKDSVLFEQGEDGAGGGGVPVSSVAAWATVAVAAAFLGNALVVMIISAVFMGALDTACVLHR